MVAVGVDLLHPVIRKRQRRERNKGCRIEDRGGWGGHASDMLDGWRKEEGEYVCMEYPVGCDGFSFLFDILKIFVMSPYVPPFATSKGGT